MLSKLDRELLARLVEDSRASIISLAKDIGASRQAVAKRLEKLKRSGLVKFTAVPDSKALGLSLKAYILVRISSDAESRARFEAKVKRMKQLSQVHYVYGRFDALVEALVRDHVELSKLVKALHRVEGVQETETYIVREAIKDKPMDPLLRALKA
ncbi:MAG: hypothetical protein DRJ69_02295 [Thermoprotei archaeon]|nr:MAG: hypothetical protein DRJ69_02295 [Thermoprotei archaeon]